MNILKDESGLGRVVKVVCTPCEVQGSISAAKFLVLLEGGRGKLKDLGREDWSNVRMEGWMIGWRMDGWMDGVIENWRDRWRDGWTEGWMEGWNGDLLGVSSLDC